jgi:hypothetical protein
MKIGEKIEELHHLRQQIRVDEAAIKELKEEFDRKQWELMQQMEDAGLDQAKSNSATVFVSKDTVPTVKDWDVLTKYIAENDAYYLFQRRVSASAWKELLEMGEDIPGVEPFEKPKLNMRAN